MPQRLAPPVAQQPMATPAAPAFTIKATKTHVEVRANDKALGMRDLLTTMGKEPLLHNCVIEQCAFDGDRFTATLRIQR